MRTAELMDVALKFSKKPSSLGRLWVAWEPAANSTPLDQSKVIDSRKAACSSSSFHRRIQTGISLCFATLLFTALVFFLVCTLDSSFAVKNFPLPSSPSPPPPPSSSRSSSSSSSSGRMGTIFQRGTRTMTEIIIAHVGEDLSSHELGLFLRVLHRSGLLSKADLVLLFPGDPHGYSSIVSREIERFNQLVHHSGCSPAKNNTSRPLQSTSTGPSCRSGASLLSNSTISRLNLDSFVRAEGEGRARAELALARFLKNNTTSAPLTALTGQETEDWVDRRARNWIAPRGSVTGFDVAELDPLDTLSGFIDEPGIQLRRWLCYGMLLGSTREHQRYRQAVITQARGVFLLGDSLLAIARRYKDSRGLVLVTEDRTWLEDGSVARAPTATGREVLSSDDAMDSGRIDSLSGQEQQGVDWSGQRHRRKRSYSRRRRRRPGMIEEVYGRQVWGEIEMADKAEWEVVCGAVVAGGARAVRSLAEAVATEVVRAAMMRRSRHGFGDQAALNYVVRRNANVLGRKVVEQLVFVGGGAGGVRIVTHGTVAELEGAARYDVVVASGGGGGDLEAAVGRKVAEDLCSSPRESAVYSDCRRDQ